MKLPLVLGVPLLGFAVVSFELQQLHDGESEGAFDLYPGGRVRDQRRRPFAWGLEGKRRDPSNT